MKKQKVEKNRTVEVVEGKQVQRHKGQVQILQCRLKACRVKMEQMPSRGGRNPIARMPLTMDKCARIDSKFPLRMEPLRAPYAQRVSYTQPCAGFKQTH